MMLDSVCGVLENRRRWAVAQADCLDFLRSLPADSVDLVMGSPPYTKQRTYGIDFDKDGQDWVDWMVEVFRAAQMACKGLVCMVVEGAVKQHRWSATPALLMADLHRVGLHLRKPPIYYRLGIPGSGGKQWLKNNYEFMICTARPGPLPWADNRAMGHPPKSGLGGEMSYRNKDGSRQNDHHPYGLSASGTGMRRANGKRRDHGDKTRRDKRFRDRGKNNGKDEIQRYQEPAIANPGNVIRCKVGGGQMGNRLAHVNEAPYPEFLCEFMIRSFCPPNGVCLDPFAGSGTTLAVALQWQRRAIGCDIREKMVRLTEKRISGVTPTLFPERTS